MRASLAALCAPYEYIEYRGSFMVVFHVGFKPPFPRDNYVGSN